MWNVGSKFKLPKSVFYVVKRTAFSDVASAKKFIHQLNIFLIESVLAVQWRHNNAGKLQALLGGYTFYSDDRYAKTTIWHCTMRGKYTKCKARFTTNKDREVIRIQNLKHTHPPASYQYL